ncbi:hypothetical protein JVT61DRAFT_4137 [Boletus reticuloceps]|uniref:Uncharacterized protein n=1 Tax=Boletus reticuloceps TaxID=495285 RepID=A0A8I3A7N8_9AGAM|nr:hypothetical protein JVT61DRAFT_4137 [Boletus reticuloceps]
MYNNLTYEWANTLFALISVAMIPIPFVSTVCFFFLVEMCYLLTPLPPLLFFPSCQTHFGAYHYLHALGQILFVYGAAIRKRSQVSRKILALQEEKPAPETKQANEA